MDTFPFNHHGYFRRLREAMINLLFRLTGLFILLSSIMAAFRFGGEGLGLCKGRNVGANRQVICVGDVEFRGSDILSIYRVRIR